MKKISKFVSRSRLLHTVSHDLSQTQNSFILFCERDDKDKTDLQLKIEKNQGLQI
jgi:hypothetical protein